MSPIDEQSNFRYRHFFMVTDLRIPILVILAVMTGPSPFALMVFQSECAKFQPVQSFLVYTKEDCFCLCNFPVHLHPLPDLTSFRLSDLRMPLHPAHWPVSTACSTPEPLPRSLPSAGGCTPLDPNRIIVHRLG